MPGTPTASPLSSDFSGSGLPRSSRNMSRVGVAAGLFAVVDRDRAAARRVMHQHEAAAAEIAGAGQRDREREADRDRGIDGIAALLEDLEADPGRGRLLARDHAVLGEYRMDDRAPAVAGRRRLSKRGRPCQDEPDQAMEPSSVHALPPP